MITKGIFKVENINCHTIVSFELPIIERILENRYPVSAVWEPKYPDFITEDINEGSLFLEYCSIVKALHYDCEISIPHSDESKFKALAVFDTGTSMSAISKTFAKKIGVIPLYKSGRFSVNKRKEVDVCLINVHLFNGHTITVHAFIQDEDERQDLLIGMDIISTGALTVDSIYNVTSVKFELLNPAVDSNNYGSEYFYSN